jgi:hypothetical protein
MPKALRKGRNGVQGVIMTDCHLLLQRVTAKKTHREARKVDKGSYAKVSSHVLEIDHPTLEAVEATLRTERFQITSNVT